MQYGIEIRSESIDFFDDMNRAITRAVRRHEWATLRVIESRENSVIYIADGDLGKFVVLSGGHRRVKPESDGKVHVHLCQVEIYPILDTEIRVKFFASGGLGLISVHPPKIVAIADTGRIETPWRKEADKEIRRDLTGLLASRTVTRDRRMNWILRPGKEYGTIGQGNKMAAPLLGLQEYQDFFDGNFDSFLGES